MQNNSCSGGSRLLRVAASSNKLMGAATLDRLRDGAYRIVLDGETRRKPRPMPETTPQAAATKGRPKPVASTRPPDATGSPIPAITA